MPAHFSQQWIKGSVNQSSVLQDVGDIFRSGWFFSFKWWKKRYWQMHWNSTGRTKRKWWHFPSRATGSRSQTFPSSYPLLALPGGQGRQISVKLYNAGVTLLSAYLKPRTPKYSWPVTLFAQQASSAFKRTFTILLVSPSYHGHTLPHTDSSNSVKTELPSVVYLCLENPIKACHKTHVYFPRLLQES